MSTATYQDALRVAQQLTPEEQARLREDLALIPSTASGATLVEQLLALEPLDDADWDAMEQKIEAGCEQVDPHDW